MVALISCSGTSWLPDLIEAGRKTHASGQTSLFSDMANCLLSIKKIGRPSYNPHFYKLPDNLANI